MLTDGKVSHHSTDSSLVCQGTALLGTELLQHCKSTAHLVQTSGKRTAQTHCSWGLSKKRSSFPAGFPTHLLRNGSVLCKGKTRALEKQNKQGMHREGHSAVDKPVLLSPLPSMKKVSYKQQQ